LGQRHNDLVQCAFEVALTLDPSGVHASAPTSLSSRRFGKTNAITYDFERDILRAFEDRCLTAQGYDFNAAEDMLANNIVGGRPLINLEIPLFQFLGEDSGSQSSSVSGSANSTAALSRKVPQENLPIDVSRAITHQIGSNEMAIRRAIESTETLLGFILATGGNVLGNLGDDMREMHLVKYAEDVLLHDDLVTKGFGARAIIEDVRLKHVASLLELLQDQLGDGRVFANVRPRYKFLLSKEEIKTLTSACEKIGKENLENALLPVMKRAIATRLTEDFTNDKEKVKVFLGFSETPDGDYFNDLSWFSNYFPSNLAMSVIVECFVTMTNFVETA